MFKQLQDEYFQSDYSRFDLFLVAKMEKLEAENKTLKAMYDIKEVKYSDLEKENYNLKAENDRLAYKAVRWDASQI